MFVCCWVWMVKLILFIVAGVGLCFGFGLFSSPVNHLGTAVLFLFAITQILSLILYIMSLFSYLGFPNKLSISNNQLRSFIPKSGYEYNDFQFLLFITHIHTPVCSAWVQCQGYFLLILYCNIQ